MIASSTTSPIAITNPARTMTLIVVARKSSTTIAAMRDSGMATTLINAVRHSKRKKARITITRRDPTISAQVRLSIASSMKVAGRKMVLSISMPERPGRIFSKASSTPRVTSSVLAHGNFSTMSRMPGPPLITASPISGHVPSLSSATSLRTSPGLPLMGRLARSSGPAMGTTFWTQSLWLGVSMKPPVPMYPPSENCINPESRASAVVSFIWSRVTPLPFSRSGSTCTWSILIRSPQMETLATPGTSSRRGLIFQ